jgi:replicative DNA helicase
MKLSAPIRRLRHKAKLMSRAEHVPLHQALDRVAAGEGVACWSLLAERAPEGDAAAALYRHLAPGDLLLVAARPGQGKTLLSLKLAVEAMRAGHRAIFFTLEYTAAQMLERFRAIGADPAGLGEKFSFDDRDAICAAHIIRALEEAPAGTLAVIDYLQLLDQKRTNPPLAEQVGALADFARRSGVILVFIAQVDRSYETSGKACPDLADIRLPNPLDLALFGKVCFLHGGKVRFGATR